MTMLFMELPSVSVPTPDLAGNLLMQCNHVIVETTNTLSEIVPMHMLPNLNAALALGRSV